MRNVVELVGCVAVAALCMGCEPADETDASQWSLVAIVPPPNSVAGNVTGQNAGCDRYPVSTSCDPTGPGVCCDIHDTCISRYCAPPDSGNVLECWRRSFTDNPCSAACQACHDAVTACFGNNPPGQPRGPSTCCGPPNVCGQLQQCILNGRVETDACVCEANGVRPHEPCKRDGGVPQGAPPAIENP